MRKPSEPARIQQIEDGINQLEARWITIPIQSKEVRNKLGDYERLPVPAPCIMFLISAGMSKNASKSAIYQDIHIYSSLTDKYPSPANHECHFDLSKLSPIPIQSLHKDIEQLDGKAQAMLQQMKVY